MYYVYIHKRKETEKIFYVGKGTISNRGTHRADSTKNRNIHWHRVVEKDGGYDYEIFKDGLTESEAFELEKKLIEDIGIENLCNMTEGGMGGDTLSNHPNIDDIGKKISDHHKGKNNPNYGKGYYYWWVRKYGKEKAEAMQEDMLANRKNPHKGTKGEFSTGLFGNKNPAKRKDVREKIRQSKLNQEKIECPKCGKVMAKSRLSLHEGSKKCKKLSEK